MQFAADPTLFPLLVQLASLGQGNVPRTHGDDGSECETIGVVSVYLVEEQADEGFAGELCSLQQSLVGVGR